MYFSSQNVLSGLSDLHQSIRSITQVRQLRQLVNTQQEFLKKAALNKLTEDELVILRNTEEQMNTFFAINLELAKNNAEVYKLISDAKATSIHLTEQTAPILNKAEDVKINSLIVDQYILEIQDLLGKVQLVLAKNSDDIFNEVYKGRFTPLIAGLVLSMIFLVFAVWMGIVLKNKIDEPIQRLIEATKALTVGNLSARAPVGETDEVGALTHAFNVMAGKLEESVNEREKVAEDLQQAKDAAETASRAKSAFLANMSHEIRTPLGAVLGFADLIVDPQVPPAEKAHFVAAIKRNGELLSSIINDILDLSKIEAGKMQVMTRETTLIEVLTDTKTLLELQAKEKGIELSVTLGPKVPETIKTDALRLRQILINIIGNAIKFTSKGKVDVTVKLEKNSEGKELLAFVVCDTGRGISEDQVEKLFAPFSQADFTLTRKFGGTGLGLVLSKRFAHLLGGDVVLTQTKLGEGSTFTITIDPGHIQATHPHEDSKAKLATPQKDLPLDGIRVLLAEDSPDNQVLVTLFLKLAGATIDIASNGKEATEKAHQGKYDVVLMDLQMPVMDGFEATAQLRKEGYRGKIIALTAHALNEDKERTLQSGFDDHISKPVKRENLIERVFLGAKQT